MKISIPHNINSEGAQITGPETLSNFWQWFKKSKVVVDGKPEVVYHGSASTFESFDVDKISGYSIMNKQGPGFYYTDKKNASQYLKASNEHGAGQRASKTSKLYAVYLSIQKPLHITERSSVITLEQAIKLYSGGDNAWFYSNWIPFTLAGATINNVAYTKAQLNEIGIKERVKLYATYLHSMGGNEGDTEILSNLVRAYHDKSKMFEVMRKTLKADGLIFTDRIGHIYVAWSPNQIKSIANDGSFSTDDNIYS